MLSHKTSYVLCKMLHLGFCYSVKKKKSFAEMGFAAEKLFQECFSVAQLNVVPGNDFKLLAKERPRIYYIIIINYNAINNCCYDYLTLLSMMFFLCAFLLAD